MLRASRNAGRYTLPRPVPADRYKFLDALA